MQKIYKVAIIEDEAESLQILIASLHHYENDNPGLHFDIVSFGTVERFLDEEKNHFDLVFMDIELPGINGMEGARQLRKFDTEATLIFVTRIAQFAIEGYSVSALDYILKPVVYPSFRSKIDRALLHIDQNEEHFLEVKGDKTYKIGISQLLYVDVRGHRLSYHLTNGTILEKWNSLVRLAEITKDWGFALPSSYTLVNLRYIHSVKMPF